MAAAIHDRPPSDDRSTAGSPFESAPLAKHTDALAQVRLFSNPLPANDVSDQCAPPSEVEMTLPLEFVVSTAQQCVGSGHEIDGT